MNKVEIEKKNEKMKNNIVEHLEKEKHKERFSLDDLDMVKGRKDSRKDDKLKRKSSMDLHEWIYFPTV